MAADTEAPDVTLPAPLGDGEACDVLAYWLVLLRYQEALAARPKARRRDVAVNPELEGPPSLESPQPGQDYAKLEWQGREAFLATGSGHAEAAVHGDMRGFCEDWLATVYRRGDDDSIARVGHLLAFPTLMLHNGELAGVLRCPVELAWLTEDGKRFTPPGAKERAAPSTLAPPVRLRLSYPERDEGDALPFFVDVRLLHDTLRLDSERIDQFFSALRERSDLKPRSMLDALTACIEAECAADRAPSGGSITASDATPAPAAGHAEALERLQRAIAARLAQVRSRARSYPVALILNGDRSRATVHAQRDLEAARELITSKELPARSPLSRYLRGQVLEREPRKTERCLGRYRPSGLTRGQLDAIELSLNQRLTAVQGPPGTGKTTLILNRIADQLVRKLAPLLSGYAVDDAILVVTSTNNAAVDNVTTPLGGALGRDRLPLALRVGSREVTERLSVADLSHCKAWLERHTEAQSAPFTEALQRFRDCHAAALAADAGSEQAEALGYALFEAACALRESWAVQNRKNLLNVLTVALRAAESARSLRKLLENPSGGGSWLRRLFPAWGSTLLSLGNVFPSELGCVAHVIIDEAGQCHPGYAISALLRAHSALVIGDVHQLEPVINLSAEDERRIVRGARVRIAAERIAPYRTHDESGSSAQSLADRAVALRPTLRDHFRCQPEIAAICDELCGYGLVAHTPRATRADRAPLLEAPVLFTPVDAAQERHTGSWMNDGESAAVVQWLTLLLAAGIAPDDIGVITPFRGQLDRLASDLVNARLPVEQQRPARDSDNLELFGAPSRGISLGTVHRFQGGERSIILFSTTISAVESLRFVDARVNLLNVAASRAREHLITIGHAPTLSAGRHTRALVRAARPVTLERLAAATLSRMTPHRRPSPARP